MENDIFQTIIMQRFPKNVAVDLTMARHEQTHFGIYGFILIRQKLVLRSLDANLENIKHQICLWRALAHKS